MLKIHNTLTNHKIAIRASERLLALIAEVPLIQVEGVDWEPAGPNLGIDFLIHLQVAGQRRTLACEVQSNGQPRYVRSGLLQLRHYAAGRKEDVTIVLIAPYLSPEVQLLCRKEDASYLDFEGNVRLAFDGIFISHQGAHKPVAERRALRSLFKPKSAQILRLMLRDPRRAWRVADLAETAKVSLGHVSNVRAGLRDREWAEVSGEGLFLSEPDALLDAWRDAYEPLGERRPFYTALHGKALEEAACNALGDDAACGRAVFASFSAAQWLAPYGRTSTRYFYADEEGQERLRKCLKLSLGHQGENIVITVPKEEGVFLDTLRRTPDIICTSAIQTYLDLSATGERGREAADHLRHEMLTWSE
jgi:hypothetical protein